MVSEFVEELISLFFLIIKIMHIKNQKKIVHKCSLLTHLVNINIWVFFLIFVEYLSRAGKRRAKCKILTYFTIMPYSFLIFCFISIHRYP